MAQGGRILKYITLAQQRELCKWLGAHGNTYENYLAWCDQSKIAPEKRYTRDYFRIWKNKPRFKEMIVEAKRTYMRSASRYAVTEKRLRTEMLEQQFADIQADIDQIRNKEFRNRTDKENDYLLKLEESKRKTLIEIAKEMGEYNEKPETQRPVSSDKVYDLGAKLLEKRAASAEG